MPAWLDIRSGIAGSRGQLTASLKNPQQAQWALLQRILQENSATEFGKQHGFVALQDWRDFRRAIPLQSYAELQPDIGRMMVGERSVRCEDVRLFEQTGGSSGGAKFLPFTTASLKDLQAALLPWLEDLLMARPGIEQGKAYWAISPAARKQSYSEGGMPIGIDNDAEYFGAALAEAIAATLAVPSSVASITDIEQWQFATRCHLLACRDLSFISVWSPTFLLQLLNGVETQLDRIARTIADGLSVGGVSLHADPLRATELQEIFGTTDPSWQQVWPALDTLSCWTSASSKKYAKQLAEIFPKAHIQGKGLLATEGAITVPLQGAPSPVLAVNSGVFEFLAANGDVLMPWELTEGETYSVVMTTAGGLYRYQLGDRVVVTGWYEATPCLDFVGREGASDLCGEKLAEVFVAEILDSIPGFSVLVPLKHAEPEYLLLLDAATVDANEKDEIRLRVERKLMTNPQYRYARELGQLLPLTVRRIDDPEVTYQDVCMQAGQRLGDIKFTSIARQWWGERYVANLASGP